MAASERGFAVQPVPWLLMGAGGMTNAGFNWAVTVGDVVRCCHGNGGYGGGRY